MVSRRRVHRAGLGALLVGSLVACAAQKPENTEVVWLRTDGSAATREEVETAGKACSVETRKAGGEGTGRFAHIEWSVNMLDCMKRKGYERVERTSP